MYNVWVPYMIFNKSINGVQCSWDSEELQFYFHAKGHIFIYLIIAN